MMSHNPPYTAKVYTTKISGGSISSSPDQVIAIAIVGEVDKPKFWGVLKLL